MSEKEREQGDEAQARHSERSCCGPGEAPETMQGCCAGDMVKMMQACCPDGMVKMMQERCPDGADTRACEAMMQKMLGGESAEPGD